eukprot:8346991-Pyramimonas_sp.AAC.1
MPVWSPTFRHPLRMSEVKLARRPPSSLRPPLVTWRLLVRSRAVSVARPPNARTPWFVTFWLLYPAEASHA